MDISVVIPLLNEKDSLKELSDSISDVMKSYNFSYEIIFIDDGSSDESWNTIEELSSKYVVFCQFEIPDFKLYRT